MCPHCKNATKVVRLHCPGEDARPPCWERDCHIAALCNACGQQWVERCSQQHGAVPA